MIDQLLDRSRHADPPVIVVTTFQGRRGHPVVFDRAFRSELMALTGDVGARPVLEAHPEVVLGVEVGDGRLMEDIDTWEAYTEARVL
jgi:molybdenum cofactor cytidylyltransferase